MAFSINWTDFPEVWDSESELSKVKIIPQLPNYSDFVKKDSNHIFIQGDNYPCLSVLTKEFSSKVDFIYIDPPYNTGKSFTYNDNFSGAEDSHSVWRHGISHGLKPAFSREVSERMTEEEVYATPWMGTVKPWNLTQAQDDDDLPAGNNEDRW